jgi:hypothetical protein
MEVLVTVEAGIASVQRLPMNNSILRAINIVVVDMDVLSIDENAQITERFDATD